MYFSKINNLVFISDSTKKIIKKIKKNEINDEIKLLALMSGYTISNYTIFKKVLLLVLVNMCRLEKRY